ncbi:MAG: arsenate reductase ArsC [Gammaproteobacteria bacterium]
MSTAEQTNRVLFVCRHNAVRSQIAEALLRHRVAGSVFVTSAGVEPEPVPHEIRGWVEQLNGGDTEVRSKALSEVSDKHFDTIITLCDKSHAALAEHPEDSRHIRWDFHHPDDPSSLKHLEIELAERIDLLVQVNRWDRASTSRPGRAATA